MVDQASLFEAPPPERSKMPSAQLDDLMNCRIAWDDAPEAIKSWAQFYFYKAAVAICRMPDRDKRKAALEKVPEPLRQKVEAEVIRIWPVFRPKL